MSIRRLRTIVLSAAAPAALSLALLAAPLLFADQPAENKPPQAADKVEAPPAPGAEAAAAETASAPEQSATISPEAKQVIDKIDAAYAGINRLELAGTFSADLNAAGTERKESKAFTATFAAPNKFRHLMQDDILVGSTGEKAYAYMEERNLYTQAEAPKEKTGLQKMPEPIPQVIQMQNPGLMLAMVKSAAAELSSTFTDIAKAEDTKIGDDAAAYPTLRLTLPNKMVVTMLFHPETHLLRQARTDIKPMLEDRGTPDVKNATLTVDYTTVKANEGASVKEEAFAWSPPKDARDLAEMAAAQAQGGGGAGGSAALEGKPAPDFTVKDMDGKDVALKDLKGKVVVLDVWATWCPPCRASLPHLDKLYEETKDKGVLVYAVNHQEEKADVQAFVEQTKLKTPVLLDEKGTVVQAYKAEGIPQTMVIGKDGTVKKVIVGFEGEKTSKELKEAVEAAMK